MPERPAPQAAGGPQAGQLIYEGGGGGLIIINRFIIPSKIKVDRRSGIITGKAG